MRTNYFQILGQQSKNATAAPASPGFSKMDGAEMAMDIGTSFIPFGGSIWQGLKAGYHGLTGQTGKMKSDLGWMAAGLIPGVSGVGKALQGGSKLLPGLAKAVPVISKLAPSGKILPKVMHSGVQMAAGTAIDGAISKPTPLATPAAKPMSVAQSIADQV